MSEATPIIEHYHCATCHSDLTVEGVIKMPLDYVKEADGTLVKGETRFSVFCNKCQKFLIIIDPVVQEQLNKLTK